MRETPEEGGGAEALAAAKSKSAPRQPPATAPRTEVKAEAPPTPPEEAPTEYSYEYYTEEEPADEDAEVPPPNPKKAKTNDETTKSHDPHKGKKVPSPKAPPQLERAKDKKEVVQNPPKPVSVQEAAQADVDKAREAVALARQMAKDLERQYRHRFGERPRGSGATSSGLPRDEDGREVTDHRRRLRSPERSRRRIKRDRSPSRRRREAPPEPEHPPRARPPSYDEWSDSWSEGKGKDGFWTWSDEWGYTWESLGNKGPKGKSKAKESHEAEGQAIPPDEQRRTHRQGQDQEDG